MTQMKKGLNNGIFNFPSKHRVSPQSGAFNSLCKQGMNPCPQSLNEIFDIGTKNYLRFKHKHSLTQTCMKANLCSFISH